MICKFKIQAAIALALTLSACGTRFGFSVEQSLVLVKSNGQSRLYYLIRPDLLPPETPKAPFMALKKQQPNLAAFLITQQHDITNQTPFRHQTGLHVLLADCSLYWEAQIIDIQPNTTNELSVRCEQIQ